SAQVNRFGSELAFRENLDHEYERNRERFALLRWAQQSFDNFTLIPPGMGICHQINLEYLSRCIQVQQTEGRALAIPDTLVGTDSHTTMVNGLGVLGWGVGGIEAEAAMLGQPVSMLIPRVVGFKLTGEIPAGVTATDVVLTITEMLRRHGVVGKFVEFYGESVAQVPLANRATIGNMSPEFGSTAAIFPIKDEDAVELQSAANGGNGRPSKPVKVSTADRGEFILDHGAVVIASITSCTNTSNPSVMLGAALLARNAVDKGLAVKPWVKTSM